MSPRSTSMGLCSALAACVLASAAIAQDRAGRDTAGDWIVDHFQSFGLWDSACDFRQTNGEREVERCYVRYVDAFSPEPAFAAQFFFLTPGPSVEFGIEAGTRFAEGGFRIERDGAIVWATSARGCLRGQECTFDGDEAESLLATMAAGGTFAFDFTDRDGMEHSLRWDLYPFAEALSDFIVQSTARGL